MIKENFANPWLRSVRIQAPEDGFWSLAFPSVHPSISSIYLLKFWRIPRPEYLPWVPVLYSGVQHLLLKDLDIHLEVFHRVVEVWVLSILRFLLIRVLFSGPSSSCGWKRIWSEIGVEPTLYSCSPREEEDCWGWEPGWVWGASCSFCQVDWACFSSSPMTVVNLIHLYFGEKLLPLK